MSAKRSLTSTGLTSNPFFHIMDGTSPAPVHTTNYRARRVTATTDSVGKLDAYFKNTPLTTIPAAFVTGAGNTAYSFSTRDVRNNSFHVYVYNPATGNPIANTSIDVNWLALEPVISANGISAGIVSDVTTAVSPGIRVNFGATYSAPPKVIVNFRDVQTIFNTNNVGHYITVDTTGFNIMVYSGTPPVTNTGSIVDFSWMAVPQASSSTGFSAGDASGNTASISASFGATYAAAPVTLATWTTAIPDSTPGYGPKLYTTSNTTTGFTGKVNFSISTSGNYQRYFNWVAVPAYGADSLSGYTDD